MSLPSASSAAATALPSSRLYTVALAGNPNVGKTTLFNALTGQKQKIANYPGVTVEKKSGRAVLIDAASGGPGGAAAGIGVGPASCEIIDLPGTYSLASRSPDEHVARQVLLGQIAGTPRPDVIVVVCDASNLERNLFLVTQVRELGRPMIVALTMLDVAARQGRRVDVKRLEARLGCVVVPLNVPQGSGLEMLRTAIARQARPESGPGRQEALTLRLPELMETHVERLRRILLDEGLTREDQSGFDAHLMLSTDDDVDSPDPRRRHPRVRPALHDALTALASADVDPVGAEIEAHYTYINSLVSDVISTSAAGDRPSLTDRLDRVLTHKVWGMLTFVGVMALVFVSIFYFAEPVMEFLQFGLIGGLGNLLGQYMAEGPLKSLLIGGVIGGVGNVVVFLPQIALLFLFLALLEDSGYMSRAAFLMDRVMARVGLHGKSFIPLLSGFACAVPAIMGTRVIENKRDRLATILVLPFMSCSARLPIYLLVIGAFFGTYSIWTRGGILLGAYALGTITAFGMAWLFKRTLLRGPAPAFILEMPPYRLPKASVVLKTTVRRCGDFLKRAGTVIFAFSVIMWAATNYPKPTTLSRDYAGAIAALEAQAAGPVATPAGQDSKGVIPAAVAPMPEAIAQQITTLQDERQQEELEYSTAGRVGKWIAPVFAPLGLDWKMSIGVTGAFFAREIIVSTMGIVYAVGEADETSTALQTALRHDYSPLVGLVLIVFVVYCMQCMSTLAIVYRETGGWTWPAFMFGYMTLMAYVASLALYQIGTALGY